MFAIYKKELKNYIYTPIGYVFIGLFLLILSVMFYGGIFSYKYLNFEYLFYDGITVLLFILPLLTMRLFSEERKNGTEQLLLTSPRSLTSIVLGKFFAAATILLISEGLTFMYFFILKYFGDPSLPVALVTLLGFFLLSLAYLSVGMFISSITENQIIAAVATVGVYIFMVLVPQLVGELESIWLIYFFESTFIEGILALDNVILMCVFTIIFILLTIMMLQKRKNLK